MKNLIALDPRADMAKEEVPFARISIDGVDHLFALVDIPEPDVVLEIEDHSVLVKIKAFSCNFRDKGYLSLFHNKCSGAHLSEAFPYSYFGSDFVGEVIGVGRCVSAFKVGDRVIPDDSFPFKSDGVFGGVVTNEASKRIQVFHESFLAKIPDTMSDYQAAGFSVSAITASSIISKANIKSGERVLITAPFSNTSTGCLSILRHRRDVELYALSTHKREAEELLKDFGLRYVFSSDELRRGQSLFDVIIDPFADVNMDLLSSHLNYNARYISCGFTNTAEIDFNVRKILFGFISHNAVFIANCLGNPGSLKMALSSFERGEYDVFIDSVCHGEQLSLFVERSFKERHFGKVVYVYD